MFLKWLSMVWILDLLMVWIVELGGFSPSRLTLGKLRPLFKSFLFMGFRVLTLPNGEVGLSGCPY